MPVPCKSPENIVSALSAPAVNKYSLGDEPRLIVPEPEIEPTSSLEPNSYVAPLLIETAVELLRLPELFVFNLPPLIVVAPVYV